MGFYCGYLRKSSKSAKTKGGFIVEGGFIVAISTDANQLGVSGVDWSHARGLETLGEVLPGWPSRRGAATGAMGE